MKALIISTLITVLMIRKSIQLSNDAKATYKQFVANKTIQYENIMNNFNPPKNNISEKYLPPIGNKIEDGKVIVPVVLWYKVGDVFTFKQ